MSGYLTSTVRTITLSSLLDSSYSLYGKTLQQLSSGNRATTIGDDPLNVVNSRKIQCTIDSGNHAVANMNLGNDLLATAQSTQSNVIDNLQRIRDLCMEAANGSYSSDDKDGIITEIKQRLSQIDSTADSTNFNGIKLFDGTLKTLKIQMGPQSSNSVDIASAFTNLHASQLGGDIRLNDTITGETWNSDDIDKYMTKIDDALGTLINNCDACGGFSNRFDTSINVAQNKNINLTELNSILTDTDTASACSDLVKYQILQQATASIAYQANQVPEYAIQLLQSIR